jgi:hypothetical protein
MSYIEHGGLLFANQLAGKLSIPVCSRIKLIGGLQLEERLKETIDEEFKGQVSFEAEQEQFVG